MLDRDEGCVFCKVGYDDGDMHKYLPSSVYIRWRGNKPYACCEWHYMMMAQWASNEKASEMEEVLTEYLKDADDMRDF